jgi:hypothetical protein
MASTKFQNSSLLKKIELKIDSRFNESRINQSKLTN